MDEETEIFLERVSNICRDLLIGTTEKPFNEKTLDDHGAEYLASAYLFLYDGHTPDTQQFEQLKIVASTVAKTYKQIIAKGKTKDKQEKGLLQICRAFLYLWFKKVTFPKTTVH